MSKCYAKCEEKMQSHEEELSKHGEKYKKSLMQALIY